MDAIIFAFKTYQPTHKPLDNLPANQVMSGALFCFHEL